MDILCMPKMQDGYYLLVAAREYFSRWAEARPQKQHTLQNVANYLYDMIICQFGTPGSIEENTGAENQKSTDLLPKYYNIWMITITPHHAPSNGVTE